MCKFFGQHSNAHQQYPEWVKSYEGIYTAGNWSIVLDGGYTANDDASGQDATTP